MLLIKFLVKICGGFWKVKEKCNMKNGIRRKFYLILFSQISEIKSTYIGYKATIPNIPIFPHGLNGIFISGYASIGSNCIIYQQVTIGANNIPGSKTTGTPKIGNNVYIGAGAKIIGGITIGNNVRIGANCVVVKDVSDNCVVVNQQSIIIQKDNLVNRFYEKPDDGQWAYRENDKIVKLTDLNIINQLNQTV